MLSADSRVVSFTWPAHQLTLAKVISVLTAESEVQSGAIVLCLASKLAGLHQRVLLIDLDASNEISRLCGVKQLAGPMKDLVEADKAFVTSTSCIAANKPLTLDARFNFNTVGLVPAGLQSHAAITTLLGLCSRSTQNTVFSAASLQSLRKEYDFIFLNAPPTHTPYMRQNLLANFALWKTHVVLMLYMPVDPFSRMRFVECAQLIRSSRVTSGSPSAYEAWVVSLEAAADWKLLQDVQLLLNPNLARQLRPLKYKPLVEKLAPLQESSFEVRHRLARVREVADQYLEPLARQCLSLRE